MFYTEICIQIYSLFNVPPWRQFVLTSLSEVRHIRLTSLIIIVFLELQMFFENQKIVVITLLCRRTRKYDSTAAGGVLAFRDSYLTNDLKYYRNIKVLRIINLTLTHLETTASKFHCLSIIYCHIIIEKNGHITPLTQACQYYGRVELQCRGISTLWKRNRIFSFRKFNAWSW